jgi:hypothetical protein
MLIIEVYGLPNRDPRGNFWRRLWNWLYRKPWTEKILPDMGDCLKQAVSQMFLMRSLQFEKKDIHVFYFPDIVWKGIGEELIVKVSPQSVKTGRPDQVNQAMNERIGLELANFAKIYLPRCTRINVVIASAINPTTACYLALDNTTRSFQPARD